VYSAAGGGGGGGGGSNASFAHSASYNSPLPYPAVNPTS